MAHDPASGGRIRIDPALNAAEREHLLDLVGSGRTLRGTPTGRGDQDVPFAHLAWVPCVRGCCLEWDPDREDAKWMAESLTYVVDHLLRAGARAQHHQQRHPRFGDFTFDHVASGAATAYSYGQGTERLVTVEDNQVVARHIPSRCDEVPARPMVRQPRTATLAQVIELRPRRA